MRSLLTAVLLIQPLLQSALNANSLGIRTPAPAVQASAALNRVVVIANAVWSVTDVVDVHQLQCVIRNFLSQFSDVAFLSILLRRGITVSLLVLFAEVFCKMIIINHMHRTATTLQYNTVQK